MYKKNIILVIFLGLFLINIAQSYGAGLVPEASGNPCPDGKTAATCGNYEVNDFIVLAVQISNWILGIVGSLSLIMFIYGGLMFLISAGSSETVGKAKKIIIAAVVGLTIVFSSYLIIKFTLKSIGVEWSGGIGYGNIKPIMIAKN